MPHISCAWLAGNHCVRAGVGMSMRGMVSAWHELSLTSCRSRPEGRSKTLSNQAACHCDQAQAAELSRPALVRCSPRSGQGSSCLLWGRLAALPLAHASEGLRLPGAAEGDAY